MSKEALYVDMSPDGFLVSFEYEGRGYRDGDIVTLTDDSRNYMEVPTKQNIVCVFQLSPVRMVLRTVVD